MPCVAWNKGPPYPSPETRYCVWDFQLLTDRTVHENLKFVLKATGWKNRTEIERRIGEVLQQVDMENKGYKMLNELSGGEQQRIVIAWTISNKPEIILADEPTGNLDVDTGRRIVELLQDICRQAQPFWWLRTTSTCFRNIPEKCTNANITVYGNDKFIKKTKE